MKTSGSSTSDGSVARSKKSPCASESPFASESLCPLHEVPAGCAVRIKRLEGSPEVAHRLREMGFCEEQHIKLVSQQSNVICQVCNARLGLSRTLAGTIWVERIQSSKTVPSG